MLELDPYQHEGAEFLAKRDCALLADEMGLGKTAQAIAACDRTNTEDAVVVCPASVRFKWADEFDKFSDWGRDTHLATDRKFTPQPGVNIYSFDLVRDIGQLLELIFLLENKKFKLIIDESHFCKGRKSIRTKMLIGPTKGSLSHYAEALWALSGTPAPNHPAELWALLYRFGAYRKDYWSFVRSFCTGYYPGPHDFKITGGKNIPKLRQLMAPFLLRRLKVDVAADLPPITFRDVIVEPGKADDERWYPLTAQSVWIDMRSQESALQETVNRGLANDDIVRTMEGQASNASELRRYIGLAKVSSVADLVKDDLNSGMDKVVIFAHHRDVMVELQERLSDFWPVTVYGGTPAKKREKYIKRFQGELKNPKKPDCRVFIGQIQAAGTGIDLTAAHNVVFAECSWVPGENAQAAMRCHRRGQTKPVLVRFVGMKGTLDEKIMRVFRKKTKTLTELFD